MKGGIRYALLNGPGIGGHKRPGYMGTIEYTLADYIHIWNELLQVNGLGMVYVPRGGHWNEILNSDAPLYGGSGLGNLGGFAAIPMPCHGRPCLLSITAPPLGM